MWESLKTTSPSPSSSTSELQKPRAGAKDLNAALQAELDDEEFKRLKRLSAKFIRSEISADEFHSVVHGDVLSGKDPTLYPRLVHSLPTKEKRDQLIGLMPSLGSAGSNDSPVTQANAPADSETAADDSAGNEEAETQDNENSSPGQRTNDAALSDPSDDTNDSSAEKQEFGTHGAELEASKRAVIEKEKAISSALAQKQAMLLKQAEELNKVKAELNTLAAVETRDIGVLRNKLEELDRDLTYYERDLKAKEKAYLTAKEYVEKLRSRKVSMVEHLTIMTLDVERRKEEKLNQIMQKMERENQTTEE